MLHTTSFEQQLNLKENSIKQYSALILNSYFSLVSQNTSIFHYHIFFNNFGFHIDIKREKRAMEIHAYIIKVSNFSKTKKIPFI